jgi:hypothetical protein
MVIKMAGKSNLPTHHQPQPRIVAVDHERRRQ